MRSDEEIKQDLAAYALGALDASGRSEVEALVARDGDAALELDEMLETTAFVAARVGDAEVPSELRATIIDTARIDTRVSNPASGYSIIVNHLQERIAAEEVDVATPKPGFLDSLRNAFNAGRLAFATSMAAFGVVAIVAVQIGADNVELNHKVGQMERDVQATNAYATSMTDNMSATEDMLEQAHARISRQDEMIVEMSEVNDALRSAIRDQISLTYATLRNEYQSPSWQPESVHGEESYAYLLEHKTQPVGALVVGGLDKAPADEEYRLYLIMDDTPHYVASFDMNVAGYSTVVFQLDVPLSSYNGAHITRESKTEAPDPSLADPAQRYQPH